MRCHSEHGMGHMWAPKDSPAAGATRYGHGLTRRRTREKTGRRTRLWRYISGKFVELMSWKFQESSSSRDGDIITSRLSPKVRLGWLAPPALRLALRYICMKGPSVSRAFAAHVTAPLSSGRAARSRRKIQLGYLLFGSVVRLPGNPEWTQTAWSGTNVLVPFQSFEPGRNK